MNDEKKTDGATLARPGSKIRKDIPYLGKKATKDSKIFKLGYVVGIKKLKDHPLARQQKAAETPDKKED